MIKSIVSMRTLLIVSVSILMLCLDVKSQEYPFEVSIKGSGQPVIFIPGFLCDGAVWEETVAEMKQNYECHVLTIAGFSDVAPYAKEPSLTYIKDQIKTYIADKNLRDVVLVGHSMGGFLSQWIASEQPENLSKIVVVDAFPFFAGLRNPNADTTFTKEQVQQYIQQNKQAPAEMLMMNRKRTAQFMVLDSSRWDTIVQWSADSDLNTEAYTITEMMATDLRQELANIEVPVLVLAAYAETPGAPQFTAESVQAAYAGQYEELKTGEIVVVKNSKHFIMYDQPKVMLEEINKFLQKAQ